MLPPHQSNSSRAAARRTVAVLATVFLASACGGNDASVVAGPQLAAESAASFERSSRKPASLHVYARYGSTCILDEVNVATCWGWNREGRHGDGTLVDQLLPTPVSGGLKFSALGLGDATTCGLTLAGAAYCWGADGIRWPWQTDYRLAPKLVTGGDVFSFLSSGDVSACGITTGGETKCWPLLLVDVMIPAVVSGAPAFVSLVQGYDHKCGLTARGSASCWGYNPFGQVGDGSSGNSIATPTEVPGGHRVSALAAGFFHTCGVEKSGAAWCWGSNFFGALGDGTTTDRSTPTRVSTTLKFEQISAGNAHTCALTKDGSAYCWGIRAGPNGEQTMAPAAVPGGLRFREITAGGHTCGVTRDDLVYCWGSNSWGEVGDGTTLPRLTPTLVQR
jgi:hypothetical protein